MKKNSLQTLAINDEAASALQKPVKSAILDDDIFWVQVSKFLDLLSPIADWIKKLEADDSNIHRAVQAFKELQENITGCLESALVSKQEEKKILKMLQERKEFALCPLHLAADLLNPNSQGSYLSDDQRVTALEFIHSVASKNKDID